MAFGQLTGLEISKSGPTGTIRPGDRVAFTITYYNNGGIKAIDAVITDQLPGPEFFTYDNSFPEGNYNAADQTITWDSGNLPTLGALGNTQQTIIISGWAGKKYAGDTQYDPDSYYMPASGTNTITNSATISCDGWSSSTATAEVAVDQDCGVSLPGDLAGEVKSSGGSELIYQLVVTNSGNITDKFTIVAQLGTGPDPTQGTIYRQILDENLNPVSTLSSTPTWTTPYLLPGESYVFYIKLHVDQSPANEWDYTDVTATSNYNSMCADTTSFDTLILNPKGPAISFNKIASPQPVQAGELLTYRLYIANQGDDAQSVVVTENYDNANVEFVSATPAPTTGNNIWALGTVLRNSNQQIVITVRVKRDIPNQTVSTNTATLAYSYNGTQTKSASTSTTILSGADLVVTKSADKNTAVPGDEVTYTLTLRNIGNFPATNVQIIDDYDQVNCAVTANPDGGTDDPVAGTLTFELGTIPSASGTYTLTYTTTINSTGFSASTEVLNTVIARTDDPEKDYSNNRAFWAVNVSLLSDLYVIKEGPGEVSAGEPFSYSLTYGNLGFLAINGVEIRDDLPEGMVYVGSSPAGSYDPVTGTVTWAIGDLAIDESGTLTLTVTAGCDLIGTVTNSVEIYNTENYNEYSEENNTDFHATQVADTEAPVISTEAVNNQHLGCNPYVIEPVFSGLDNCDGIFTPIVHTAGDFPYDGHCDRYQTWTATYTDAAGNLAKEVSITYIWTEDPIAPQIITPAESGDLGCNPDVVTPVFTIKADPAGCILSSEIDVATAGPVADTEGCGWSQSWTAAITDNCGNVATPVTITYTWTVDTEKPVITLLGDTEVSVCLGDDYTDAGATALDSCSGVLTPTVAGEVNTAVTGTYTLTFTVTDGCGNVATAVTRSVVVHPLPEPVISGPEVVCPASATVFSAPEGMVSYLWSVEGATISGTNTGASVMVVAGTECSSTFALNLTVTSPFGCSGITSQTVTVNVAHDFTMPEDDGLIIACASELAEPEWPEVRDACGALLTPAAPVIGTTPGCEGDVTYEYVYTDCAGHVHTWTYTYTIEVEPFAAITPTTDVVACVDDIVVPTPPVVKDNCGNLLTPVAGTAPTAPECEGEMVYTWTYTDCEGNQQTYTHTVNIEFEDFTMPANTMTTVACVDDIIVPDPPVVEDKCGHLLIAVPGEDPGIPSCGESAVYTWTYEDCAGFLHTFTHTITLQDNEFPEIDCPENISLLLPSGTTSTTVSIVLATATDNCGAEVEWVRGDAKALTDPYPLGVTSILWSATDECGNVSTCTSTVTITDRSVVSGTVFHDTNRMNDNTVNGTGVNPGDLLLANLVDQSGNVVNSMLVNANGTYSFANVLAGVYTVQISVNQGIMGSAMPVTLLPAHWIHTGEHLGAGTGSDGTSNGLLSITVDGDSNVPEANFGIVKLPDLTTTLTATKNVMNGITSFDLIIRITELNSVNTDGMITLRLPKDIRWTLDGPFDTALTMLGSVTVHNSQWIYDGSDLNYHIFTSNAVINAGSFSAIGIKVIFDPQNARGTYTITSQLQSFSGGEMRVNNNADAEKLDYFPN